MDSRGPDWDLYRSLLAVIETGSLSGAARRLGLAQPTVGRHIEALEASLGGLSLFTRSPGGLNPTEAALALKPHAEAMSAAAAALVRTAAGGADPERGVIRISASEIVGSEVLPAILAEFHREHPGVALELSPSNAVEDLLRRDVDIAVRMTPPTQAALTAKRIGSVRLQFYAHRSYLQARGEPRDLEDLAANHSLIGYDRVIPSIRTLDEIMGRTGLTIHRELFAYRTDSDLAQLAALRAGVGICACQPVIAARDPNLVPILNGQFQFELEMWVAMHEDLKASRRMRLMFDHLVAGLAEYVKESAR
ncbi:DNA-binding transcriptional LysR family regulator [Caulobacter ginsengisoli]|uniref:DNA-binding transcriptional LysR family regulator n=1 Tax=Caulobacter ginsengisoli TaxID=400775 RepID=A0ABU0IUH1_9CAUL|nr:LysR family transcriptional regulator [Caulobacter ginsengisoli]MDQ0465652.1 DNA-binding transcriptional LysR family regulator [Caulobacter ginsengisoli]